MTPSHRHSLWTCALVVLAFAMLTSACGGGMRMMKASVQAASLVSKEQASVEVCLDRLEDIDAGLTQVNTLLFETPLSSDANEIKRLVTIPPESRKAFEAQLKKEGPYSLPERQIPNIKIYRMHNNVALGTAKNAPSPSHENLMAAIAEIGGGNGEAIRTNYTNVKALKDSEAETESKIEMLNLEADKDTTDASRKEAIAKEIAAFEQEIEANEAKVSPAEDALFASISALGGTGIDAAQAKTAGNAFEILQYAAVMEIESLVMAMVVSVQAVQALPNIHNELIALAQRWAKETVSDLTGQAKGAINVTPKIDIGTSGIEFGLEGLDGASFDVQGVIDRLTGKITKFYDQAVGAPGRVSAITSKVLFQVQFLEALAKAFANLVGSSFSEEPRFSIPAAGAAN